MYKHCYIPCAKHHLRLLSSPRPALRSALVALLALTSPLGCAPAPPPRAQATLAAPASAERVIDLTAIDRSVRPGDDFFLYANGAWYAKTPIPRIAERQACSSASSTRWSGAPEASSPRRHAQEPRPTRRRRRSVISTRASSMKPPSRRAASRRSGRSSSASPGSRTRAPWRATSAPRSAPMSTRSTRRALHRSCPRPLGRTGPQRPIAVCALSPPRRAGAGGPE